MGRVHNLLRRAEYEAAAPASVGHGRPQAPALSGEELLERVMEAPFHPAPDALLLGGGGPSETLAEDFRRLAARLNRMQKTQASRTILLTSPSPAEGKSFVAANLALAHAQGSDRPVLLCDFDFRRPALHRLFSLDRSPGAAEYLLEQLPLPSVIRRIAGANLYVLTAGAAAKNPLDPLALGKLKTLFGQLRAVFQWVIVDTAPLLWSPDANLLASLADGTIVVLRIGVTTVEDAARAMQTVGDNKVLGVVANGWTA